MAKKTKKTRKPKPKMTPTQFAAWSKQWGKTLAKFQKLHLKGFKAGHLRKNLNLKAGRKTVE